LLCNIGIISWNKNKKLKDCITEGEGQLANEEEKKKVNDTNGKYPYEAWYDG
jgi:hypothetical protein